MMTKKELLLMRGFSEYDIDTNFAHYNGEWNIKTMTLEQVKAARSPDKLKPLFDMDSVDNWRICATSMERSFKAFANDYEPFDVSPSQLDPYIARICRAVNEIGAKTCMSCDGWHHSNSVYHSLKLYMKDRYSVIWFWLITEYVFGERWCHGDQDKKSWKYIWEPFNFEEFFGPHMDMIECYYFGGEDNVFHKNNCYAEFLEKHRAEFLSLKKHITDTLYEKMKNGEINDIAIVGFMKARRYMCDVFLPAAKPLIEAFRREYPQIVEKNEELYNTSY